MSSERRAFGLKAAWGVILAFAVALTGGPAYAAEPESLIIARINGGPVTAAEFAPYLQAYLRSNLFHAGSPERVRALADEAIDAFLIDRVLGEQAATRGVKIDEAEVEKRLADIQARYRDKPGWPKIRERLPKIREEVEKDARIEMLKREISRVAPPTKAEILAFYDGHHELFTRPAAYRLKFLLLAVEPGASTQSWKAAEQQAQDYAHRAAAGEDFAALARTKSNHSSAEQGGEIGLVHEGQLGDAAEAALRSANPGDIAGPVRLLEGVALFLVVEKRLPEMVPFGEVSERALTLLERDQAKKLWDGHIQTIRKQFSVDQSALETFLTDALNKNGAAGGD